MRELGWPLAAAALVGAMFVAIGVPEREELNANNARAVGGDIIRVTSSGGVGELQHLANSGGYAAPAIQSYLNQGYISCGIVGTASDGMRDANCQDLHGRTVAEVEARKGL